MEDVYYAPAEWTQDRLENMISNIKPDRSALDLFFGCILDWGLELSKPYQSEILDGCTVHTYNTDSLIACFDEDIPESVITTIARRKPLRIVFRDSSFTDCPSKLNMLEIIKNIAPNAAIKVI